MVGQVLASDMGPIQQHPSTILGMFIAMGTILMPSYLPRAVPRGKKKLRGFKHVPKNDTRMLGCFPRIILKNRMLFWDHPKDF